jgi:hypothetical protein
VSNRDDFSEPTKRALALRAGYRCAFEGCDRPTSGPSAEAEDAVTNIGKAAHICAAAPGGRRYDTSMTPEQRTAITNGIWLCAHHADLIDRDEVTYTVAALQRMKWLHEARNAEALRSLHPSNIGADLIALGPQTVVVGEVATIEAGVWEFQIHHFLIGDLPSLAAFVEGFERLAADDRYVLANQMAEGRLLAAAPVFTHMAGRRLVHCTLQPAATRMSALTLPADWALNRDGDINLKNGDIALVRGLEALPQRLRTTLSVQRGEMVFHPEFGTRLAEYHALLMDSPWLERVVKLEVIRQASIPHWDEVQKKSYTPLLCVERVHGVKILEAVRPNGWIPVDFDLEVSGAGRWQHHTEILIAPAMAAAARAARKATP